MVERCDMCGRTLVSMQECYDHVCTGCLHGDSLEEPYEELDFNDDDSDYE